MFLMLAVINGCIGIYYIQRGIQRKGKKEFLKDNGYIYIAWVTVSTIGITLKGLL